MSEENVQLMMEYGLSIAATYTGMIKGGMQSEVAERIVVAMVRGHMEPKSTTAFTWPLEQVVEEA